LKEIREAMRFIRGGRVDDYVRIRRQSLQQAELLGQIKTR
jgi:hypothetical protein